MAGLLLRIMMNTMEWYFCMLLHLRTMSSNYDVFERMGQLHLKFHADQLMQIQRYALTRSDMNLKVYIYMRDSASKGFTSIKLLNLLTSQTHLTDLNGITTASTSYDCDFCHGDYHHMALCLLRLVIRLKKPSGPRHRPELYQRNQERFHTRHGHAGQGSNCQP
jgi:hypothetical protein